MGPALYILYIYLHQRSRTKPNYGNPINLNTIIKARFRFGKIKRKELKKRSNSLIKNKKYYAYNKIGYFAQNCRLKNLINKNKTFKNITQQLNIIKKNIL